MLTKEESERLEYLEKLIENREEDFEDYQEACALKRKQMEPEYS